MSSLIQKFFQYPKTTSIFLGIVATFALPPYYQIWCLFIAFGLFACLLNRSENKLQSFLIGYCFGIGFFAVGFSWVSNALALDIKSFGWLIPLALLGSGAFFGLFSGFAAFCSSFFQGFFAKVVALGAFWGISEWLRSFIFTGFPWNLLGSIWTFDHTWLQTVSVFGSYGLSALSVIIFSLPAVFIATHSKKNIVIGILSSLIIFVFMTAFGIWHCQKNGEINNSSLSVRIVQPSIPQTLKWDFGSLEENLYKYINMSQEMGFEGKDIIIWGETASTFPLSIDLSHFEQTKQAVPPQGYLITGSIDYFPSENNRWIPVNAAHIIAQEKGITSSYIKSHLVPFGEYVPFRNVLGKFIGTVAALGEFKPGSMKQSLMQLKGLKIAPTICYESIFPFLYSSDAERGADVFVNITNDGWYLDTSAPYQHLAALVFRAAETRRPILRAANNGISAVINSNGTITASKPLNEEGVLEASVDIPYGQPLSFYVKYGNVFAGLCLLFCLAFAVTLVFL